MYVGRQSCMNGGKQSGMTVTVRGATIVFGTRQKDIAATLLFVDSRIGIRTHLNIVLNDQYVVTC